MIVLAILKIIASVALVTATSLGLTYWLRKRFKNRANNLFKKGWLFTHPEKKAIAIADFKDAKHFVSVVKGGEAVWNVYALLNGEFVKIGTSNDTLIIDEPCR